MGLTDPPAIPPRDPGRAMAGRIFNVFDTLGGEKWLEGVARDDPAIMVRLIMHVTPAAPKAITVDPGESWMEAVTEAYRRGSGAQAAATGIASAMAGDAADEDESEDDDDGE